MFHSNTSSNSNLINIIIIIALFTFRIFVNAIIILAIKKVPISHAVYMIQIIIKYIIYR